MSIALGEVESANQIKASEMRLGASPEQAKLLGQQWRRARQGHRQGILVHVADAELIVQVWAAGQSRGADKADHIALSDAITFAQARGKARQMAVEVV